ncbi:MAG: transposase [Patescibacteria group bacterium]|nr:transposase [Patescibacteria group bacterium]
MPSKNSSKQYVENGYYHIYNRGVEKRKIFIDKQDYSVFLSYLKDYLLPKDEKSIRNKLSDPDISYKEKDKILKQLRLNNFNNEIVLLAYCLMPNHFHLFIKQNTKGQIDKFMNSLGTRYTMYFNRKYKRVGPLYQSVYKAVLVEYEEQFIYLSKYIHKQALALQGVPLQGQPCSYYEYTGKRNTVWVYPEEVLGYFSKTNPNLSYESFVREPEENLLNLKDILIEDPN